LTSHAELNAGRRNLEADEVVGRRVAEMHPAAEAVTENGNPNFARRAAGRQRCWRVAIRLRGAIFTECCHDICSHRAPLGSNKPTGAPRSRPRAVNEVRGRKAVTEWLFWQVGGLGPMAGQNHHFVQYAPEKIPRAMDRYVNETDRLYGILDRRLAGRSFIAGADYTITDIASYPCIVPRKRQQQNLDDFPNPRRWFDTVRARPAVRAYAKGEPYSHRPAVTEAGKKILFGQTAAGPKAA
jgi:hypothetical protein